MAAKLKEYNNKRNFDNTPEPEGRTEAAVAEKGGAKLRFAVQHHIARRDHFDLRLEWRGVLLSWAVPKGPSFNPKDKRLAVKVEDHPLSYRGFEGTIPKGEYGGGTVMLFDDGYWQPVKSADKGLKEGSLKFTLQGSRLSGSWALVRIKAKDGETGDNWLLLKEKDEFAKAEDGIAAYTTSIKTGRTMSEIAEGKGEKRVKNPFKSAEIELAKLSGSVPKGDGWLYELKYDGYRILAFVEGGSARLMTRGGKDYTSRFPRVAESAVRLAGGRAMVLDGEMVITDAKGKSDFQALQNYMRKPRAENLIYIVFDILALDGEDVRGKKLLPRKQMLEKLMEGAPENLYLSKYVIGSGKDCFEAACALDLEGIVGKSLDSAYTGGRNGDWIKLKCDNRQEFVICGYTLSDKKTSGVSSLLLGIYKDKQLIYAGRAGTGFTQRTMQELEAEFFRIKRKTSPFKAAPVQKSNEKITWLKPQTVAEIKFAGWTEDNLLRQASFKGLRTDKNPEDVVMERADSEGFEDEIEKGFEGEHKRGFEGEHESGFEGEIKRGFEGEHESGFKDKSSDKIAKKKAPNPGSISDLEVKVSATGDTVIAGIKITSPDKVMFKQPKITKIDVVNYYRAVAMRMLPYAGNRILSIVRCPKGAAEQCFFKKHPDSAKKGIVSIPVTNSDGEVKDYFFIENAHGLISEAQMGTLEFHVWGSRADNMEMPDMMVFDLDPDEGMDTDTVRQGVRDLKDILDRLSLVSFLKTSGGKGYHVVVPLQPTAGWQSFYDFSKRIAQVMVQNWPKRYTDNIRKDSRKGKIFIDWVRNGRGATSVAPYSLRARPGARVSMPILWSELDDVAPDGIDMAAALDRISGKDPWKGFYETKQKLNV